MSRRWIGRKPGQARSTPAPPELLEFPADAASCDAAGEERIPALANLSLSATRPRSEFIAAIPLRRDEPGDFARGEFWLRALIFVAATTALFALAERDHYLQPYANSVFKLTRPEKQVLKWLLWWKTLVLFVPVLAVVGALVWRRRFRLAALSLVLFWLTIMSWLAIDLKVQQLSGTHALELLPYLYDAVAMAGTANHLQWGGDLSGNLSMVLAIETQLLILGFAGWLLTRPLVQWPARWLPRIANRAAPIVATAAVAAAVLSMWPIYGRAGPFVLRQFRQKLPYDVSLLDYGQAWFANSAAAGVQIVSLMPNPPGEDDGREQVRLHNFSDRPVVLSGWELRNRVGKRLPLQGEIRSDETRNFTLPAGSLRLTNTGDTVQLFDEGQRRIHAVTYRKGDAKYARLIHFRDPGQFGAFERQMNEQAQAAYCEVFDRMQQPPPVDSAARLQRPDSPNTVVPNAVAPNVIYIVLESFREAAVSPEVMARLDAWGQQGLRLRRHYAGTNSSHLGLFTLLYSRPAIVYEPTLDAQIDPQTTASLHGSGYQCHFVTSGDCLGFRRMGEYLREPYFDSISQFTGESFREWPTLDVHALEKVRRLATQNSGRPQFVMAFIMSTHFPYSFPPEFNLHRPSGDDIDRANWKGADPEILHNRYRNAALFLERQILRLVESLDPQRNIIVVTGDHGESMGEDGGLAHATRPSDVQMRVPMLIVGPGIPRREVTAATTHLDVLPTLLHALAGQNVPLAHSAGRDVLENDPPDQVMLWPYRWTDPREAVLIRGPQRLQFKVHHGAPQISLNGFCDERGDLLLELRDDCSPEAVQGWANALRDELHRAAGVR